MIATEDELTLISSLITRAKESYYSGAFASETFSGAIDRFYKDISGICKEEGIVFIRGADGIAVRVASVDGVRSEGQSTHQSDDGKDEDMGFDSTTHIERLIAVESDDSFANTYFQEGEKAGFDQSGSEDEVPCPYEKPNPARRWWRRGYISIRRLYGAMKTH